MFIAIAVYLKPSKNCLYMYKAKISIGGFKPPKKWEAKITKQFSYI